MRATARTTMQPVRHRSAGACASLALWALVLALLASAVMLASGARAASFPYVTQTGTGATTYTTPNGLTFTEPGSGTPNADDGTAALTLPFAFTIFGHTYGAGTTLHVSTNGVLEFADNSSSRLHAALPSSVFSGPAVLPYWTDFDLTVTYGDPIPSGDGEGAAWGVNNSAPNRVLVIRWWGYLYGSTPPRTRIGFEVALEEGTNRIDTLYTRALTDPMANGSTATIGIQEGGAGGAFVQFSHNTASIPGTGFYVIYAPHIPQKTDWPVVSGTAQVGQTLSVSTGAWDVSPDSYGYQWERCTTSDCGAWTNIAGATAPTYTLTSADVGSKVFAAVRATNGWGTSGWAFAYPTGPVSATPVNLTAPHVSGSAIVGATLTSSTGTWAGGDGTHQYEWLRCDVDCTVISGQTASTYVVTLADVGHSVASAVKAHNSSGWSSFVGSNNMAGPVPSPPTNSTRPHVTGQAQVGATLTTTTGAWSGSPDSYGYDWWRCVPIGGGGCMPSKIAGATSATYVVALADAGAKIYPAVRAHNANGWSDPVGSDNSVGPIPAPPVPVSTLAPQVTGAATVGATLTLTDGSWSNAPDAYTYEWWHCMPVPGSSGCTPSKITGATTATYVVGAGDLGGLVYARVTAHNAAGWSAAATSGNTIGPISAASTGGGGTPGGAGNSGTPGGTGGTETPVTQSPEVTSSGRVTTSIRRGTVTVAPAVAVRCAVGPSPCTVDVRAQTRVTTRRGTKTRRTWITVGSATITLRAGASVTVRIKLNKQGTALLRRKRTLSVRVTTTAVVVGAAPRRLVKTITIRQPKSAGRAVAGASDVSPPEWLFAVVASSAFS